MREYDSILFIGDPHACSKRVGRRKAGYGEGVLRKLHQCAEIALARRAVPVILGDLLHTSSENDLSYLNGLTEALKAFGQPVYTLVGNHDKSKAQLSSQDALQLLLNLGAFEALTRHVFSVGGELVSIVGADHGSAIPTTVARPDGVHTQILVTHHDLAFGGAYPGSMPLACIDGVDIVVNGHMHDTKESVQVGTTLWHNPGNIEPVSIDLRHHVPAVWLWNPIVAKGPLVRELLVHDTDCFDLTGLNIDAAVDVMAAVDAVLPAVLPTLPVSGPGQFVQELLVADSLAADRTDDASILKDDLRDVLETGAYSEAVRVYLTRLLDKSSMAS